MNHYILEVQETEDGELFLEFPDEIIEELGWGEGDILSWDLRGEGIVLTRVNEETEYEMLED